MDFSISSAPAPKSCLPKTAGACHGESSLFQSSTARKAMANGMLIVSRIMAASSKRLVRSASSFTSTGCTSRARGSGSCRRRHPFPAAWIVAGRSSHCHFLPLITISCFPSISFILFISFILLIVLSPSSHFMAQAWYSRILSAGREVCIGSIKSSSARKDSLWLSLQSVTFTSRSRRPRSRWTSLARCGGTMKKKSSGTARRSLGRTTRSSSRATTRGGASSRSVSRISHSSRRCRDARSCCAATTTCSGTQRGQPLSTAALRGSCPSCRIISLPTKITRSSARRASRLRGRSISTGRAASSAGMRSAKRTPRCSSSASARGCAARSMRQWRRVSRSSSCSCTIRLRTSSSRRAPSPTSPRNTAPSRSSTRTATARSASTTACRASCAASPTGLSQATISISSRSGSFDRDQISWAVVMPPSLCRACGTSGAPVARACPCGRIPSRVRRARAARGKVRQRPARLRGCRASRRCPRR